MTARGSDAARRYREAERRLWQSVGLSPTEQFVRLAASGTFVRVQEVGEGPPALFLHGGPNSGSTWAPMLPYAPGFRCLLLDRPGTGLSEAIPYRLDGVGDHASTLVAEVLDALGIDRAHVVASSFGGYCALRSAATTPERFDRMVQMAAPALLPGQTFPPFMKGIKAPFLRRVIARIPPTRRSNESIMRQIGHGASLDAGILPEAFLQWYEALQRFTDTMRNEFDLIHLGVNHADEPGIVLDADTLLRVRTPTHFIWGEDDTFGGREAGDWTVAVMPDATVEYVPRAGHLPWLDDPALTGRATARFLAGEA